MSVAGTTDESIFLSSHIPHVVPVDEVFAFLRRFGRNTNSFVLAYGGFDWFRCEDPPGLVPYVRSGHSFVVGGDPLCLPGHTSAVLQAFARHVGDHRRIAIVLASNWTLPSLSSLGYGAICVGSDPFFDLDEWRPRGKRGKPVRSACNRARRRGTTVSSYHPINGCDHHVETQLQTCVDEWLAARRGFLMRFFSAVRPLDWPDEKRYFCAWHEDRLDAFIACAPIYARNAWFIEDVVRRPDAVYGATELLIATAFESLRKEGYNLATLGLSPLQDLTLDHNHSLRTWVIRAAAATLHPFYNFQGMRHYKKKFAPSLWEPVYVAFWPDRFSPGLVMDIMRALIPGGFLRLARGWVNMHLEP